MLLIKNIYLQREQKWHTLVGSHFSSLFSFGGNNLFMDRISTRPSRSLSLLGWESLKT